MGITVPTYTSTIFPRQKFHPSLVPQYGRKDGHVIGPSSKVTSRILTLVVGLGAPSAFIFLSLVVSYAGRKHLARMLASLDINDSREEPLMPETDNTTSEIWKPVVGWEGWYEVSNQRRVRRVGAYPPNARGYQKTALPRILKPFLNTWGYFEVGLSHNGRQVHRKIAKLVAEAFIGPKPQGKEIHHIDGNKQNDVPENLVYLDRSEHLKRDYLIGVRTGYQVPGEKNQNAKLTASEVVSIRKRLSLGESQMDIVRDLGISSGHISRIHRRAAWKHIA